MVKTIMGFDPGGKDYTACWLLGPNASLIANLFKVHKILASRARVVVICGGPMAYMQWLTYRKNLDRAFERRLRNLELKHGR